MVGELIGVGVGPGDPELLTRRAMRVLQEADRVVAPVSAGDEPGRAELVVRDALPGLAVTRLTFDMAVDAPARTASHRRAAAAMTPWLAGGERVAFVTLGDPNIYSTFSALVDALGEAGVNPVITTVPGITAFQELASRSGTVLLDGTESLSLVTALDGAGHLADALAQPDRTVVVYKGGRHTAAIAAVLAAHGRLEGAVLGELLGLAGERIEPLRGDRPASYLATVIVPPAKAAVPDATGSAPSVTPEDHR
jgi:precorrin-2/cobalt-factor-2 C20-methyltransferase